MEVNKSVLVKVVGGLVDSRIEVSERNHSKRYLQLRWVKGMLGASGGWFWQEFLQYSEQFKDPMSLSALKTAIQGASADDADVLLYCVEYISQDSPCTSSEFRHAVTQLRKAANKERFIGSITRSLVIMNDGIKTKTGVIKGYDAARKYLASSLRAIEDKDSMDEFSSLRESSELLVDVEDGQAMKTRILSGFSVIDTTTGGGQPGELALLAGYAQEGKTMMAVNWVWHAVVEQHKNVVVYSGEMTDKQFKRRLICRHSHHPKFGIQSGLTYDDIKFGRLDPQQIEQLKVVVDDFKLNDFYGKLFIHGMSKSDHIMGVWNSVESLSSRVDMVVVDYLGLVPPIQKRLSRREELSETVRAAKNFAQGAYDGEGIYVLCLYQTNRKGRERAEEAGEYDLQALEETGEAEKATDTVIWLLRTTEMEEMKEVKVGIMKSRDSAKCEGFFLYEDYSSCYLANMEA